MRQSIVIVTASILIGTACPARAATSVVVGPANSAVIGSGYNNYGAIAGNAAGNVAASAAASAAQPQPPANSQMSKYSNVMNGQGAAYGQKDQANGSSSGGKRYHYDPIDPNDPLESVTLPDRLYHNDQAHIYHGDDCICVVGSH